jgi:hypothetical protein
MGKVSDEKRIVVGELQNVPQSVQYIIKAVQMMFHFWERTLHTMASKNMTTLFLYPAPAVAKMSYWPTFETPCRSESFAYPRWKSQVRGCIQKFPDWPLGARTADSTAFCHWM